MKVQSGVGSRFLLTEFTQRFGNSFALITNASISVDHRVLDVLRTLKAEPTQVVVVARRPDIGVVEEAVASLRHFEIRSIVAIGGGSAIDAAKCAVLAIADAPDGGTPSVRRCIGPTSPRLNRPPLPLAVLPTTLSTGSEATPFATLWNYAGRQKWSLSHAAMLPTWLAHDPELTLSAPADVIQYSLCDAVSHVFESSWNRNTDSASIQRATYVLRRILDIGLQAPSSQHAALDWRQHWMSIGMKAGELISTTRTAIAHALSYPLTLAFGVPHGLASSLCLRSIFNLTSEHRAFQVGVPIELMREVLAQLDSMDLGTQVKQYCGRNEIAALPLEMFVNERATNYCLDLSALEMRELLLGSLSTP